MALHIFNCTIDAPDLTLPNMPEDLSYNEMETITEFVAEVLLGLDNFFPEHEDGDHDDTMLIKGKVSLDSFTLPFKKPGDSPVVFSGAGCSKLAPQVTDQFDHQFFGEPNGPPPWRG